MGNRPAARLRLGALVIVGALVAGACAAGGGSVERPDVGGVGGTGGGGTPAVDPSPIVDPDDIISGGPPPDGIPPIDDPKFLPVDRVSFLHPSEPVLAVEVNGEAKAYPLRIMTWHEIVNDVIGGTPVTVTYCPLCNTGIAFERPTIDGELLDFGTSGKLYNSNLVMYDRQTESYWAQVTGQAIVGSLAGEQLAFVPARILSWRDWKAANPDGLVLSTDTGHDRPYGTNPYGGYDSSESPFLFTGEPDPRLPALSRVLGLAEGEEKMAVPYEVLEDGAVGGWSVITTTVGGREVAVFWKAGTVSALDDTSIPESRDVGAVAAYDPVVEGRRLTFEATGSGIADRETGSRWSITGLAVAGPLEGTQLEVLPAVDSFWFDWAAFHPDTAIYGT